MDSLDPQTSPEALLAEGNFVRAIARSLISDEGEAEDVVQETWLTVLRHRPRIATNAQGWLRQVVTNQVRMTGRSAGRRVARERFSARSERVPSAAEIAEREAVRASVIRAVLALEEPYRATILLRYYEELPPRVIATRMAVPVETVRTRLKRGVARLREELTRERGSRDAWALVVLRLVRPESDLAPLSSGTAGLLPFAIPAAALVALLSLVMFIREPDRGVHSAALREAPLGLERRSLGSPALKVAESNAERSSIEGQRALLAVKLFREDDHRPLSTATVELDGASSPPLRGITDVLGEVRFEVTSRGEARLRVEPTLRSLGKEQSLDLETALSRMRERGSLEVLVPAASFARGSVSGPDRSPLAGVEVLALAGLEPSFVEGEPTDLLARAKTGTDGKFEIGGLPPCFSLFASTGELCASECLLVDRVAPSAVEGVELLLVPTREVHGIVRIIEGSPLQDARIEAEISDRLGLGVYAGASGTCYSLVPRRSTRSAADGTFMLRMPASSRASLTASAPGMLSTTAPLSRKSPTHDSPVELVLEPAVVERVLVRSSEGEPIVGAEVLAWTAGEVQALTTEGEGCLLPSLRAGERVFLRVGAVGHATSLMPAREIARAAEGIDVRLEEGGSVSGTVRDADGKVVVAASVGAKVLALPDTAWTEVSEKTLEELVRVAITESDAAGHFVLEGLELGEEYEVFVIPSGSHAVEGRTRARTGCESIEVIVAEGSANSVYWNVHVVDAADGHTLPAFGIRLDSSSGGVVARGYVDVIGPVHLPPLPAETTELSVLAEGYAPYSIEIGEVQPGQRAIEVPLSSAVSLVVSVVDIEGRPLDSGTLQLRRPNGDALLAQVDRRCWTDVFSIRANGLTHLGSLAPPPFTIEVAHPSHSQLASFRLESLPSDGETHVLELPWPIPSLTRYVALLLRTGEAPGIDYCARPSENRRHGLPTPEKGARARLRIVERGGVETMDLVWQWNGRTWIEAGERAQWVESYLPDGVRGMQIEQIPRRFLDAGTDEDDGTLRPRDLALQFNAPVEGCEVFLSVDGFLDVRSMLPPSSPRDRPNELFEATLVERP